MTNLIKPR